MKEGRRKGERREREGQGETETETETEGKKFLGVVTNPPLLTPL